MSLAKDYMQMFDGFYGEDEQYDQWREDLDNFIWDGSPDGEIVKDQITYASWKGACITKIIHFKDNSYLQINYFDTYGQGDEEPEFKIVEPCESEIVQNFREVQ